MPTETTPENIFAMLLFMIAGVAVAMKINSSIGKKVAALFKSKKAESELTFDE